MTSLTLHLIVIALLVAAVVTATATTSSMAPRTAVQRGRGAAGTSTTSTQAPTLRAPRQRRPPTTLPIDISSGRGSGSSSSSSTTPLPAPPRQQRFRGTKTTTTTTTTAAPTPASSSIGRGSGSNRGSIRAARQPRDTPTLTEFEGSAESASSWRQLHQAFSSAGSSIPPFAVSSSSLRSSAGALKTPRMIQRLVAGHIHNAQGHSTYEVSAVSANSSRSRSTTATTTTKTTTSTTTTTTIQPLLNVRRKASSTYRLARPTSTPLPIPTPTHAAAHKDDDDQALLSEPDDFDNWDNGILRLSAGSGKETESESNTKNHSKQSKEEAKKTLADQVRDGKYGLIEKELFRRVPKRPGVLSYARNPEVPLDNERNFGGLSEQDIWLAEDHLLVIKGGGLNEAELSGAGGDNWPAIDDYDAPTRQIKLPANAAVPPPFPVQLEPHGPLQLIRDNQIESHHSTSGNGTQSAAREEHSAYGQIIDSAPHGKGAHTASRPGASASSKTADTEPSYVYPAPYAPWLLYPNETLGNRSPTHTQTHTSAAPNAVLRSPLLGPWLINNLHASGNSSLHANISDFDEDDPSLYYPPAYSFVYKSNYSNPVPPGPLVPGIVLPPPPDHFSRLEVTATTTTTTTRRPYSSTTSSSSSTTTTTTTPSTSSISGTGTTSSTTRTPSRLSIKYNSISYLPQSPAAPRHNPPRYVERVPVPVAVPIPIYPINYQPSTVRPQNAAQLVFVPSSSTEHSLNGERERIRERPHERDQAPLSKSNPIYYEYFEARRQPASLKSNVIDDFLATKPPKRPHYKTPPSPHNDVAVVSITPKPRGQQLHSEYDAALGQLLRSNLISPPSTGRFQAPDFDRQPFLPMVNYSADEQDQNAFKAIVYQPQLQSQPQSQQAQRQRQLRVGKHQQLQQLQQPAQDQDSYLPDTLLLQRQRQLRVGKQQLQLQLQSPAPNHLPYDNSYSTPLPPVYLDNQLQSQPHSSKYQLRPPAPAAPPLQFWQRPAAPPPQPQPAPPPPAPQFKRLRHSSAKHPYPPYFVPSYPSGSGAESLYRLLPVPQHKHWRQSGSSSNKQQQQLQPQQQQQQHHQQQQQYYPERGVNIGHSLASDILVNYNSNNQFNPQAELVPQAQLGPPPLSYQAQNGGQASLWSERPVRQSRAQLQEQA